MKPEIKEALKSEIKLKLRSFAWALVVPTLIGVVSVFLFGSALLIACGLGSISGGSTPDEVPASVRREHRGTYRERGTTTYMATQSGWLKIKQENNRPDVITCRVNQSLYRIELHPDGRAMAAQLK